MSLVAAAAAAAAVPVPQARPKTAVAKQQSAPPPGDGITDMSKAVPLRELLKQPSVSQRYRTLSGEIAKAKPALDTARGTSENLAHETASLQKKLIDSAARVEFLETDTIRIDAEVVRLSSEYARLSVGFARDRVAVSRLLAVLERRQHDVPPAMAVRPDDALAAARSAMLIGATLPRVYHDAAALAQRLNALQRTRTDLIRRRAEAVQTAAALTRARGALDQLLAIKRQESEAAVVRYGVLKTKLDTIASQAINLQSLLRKVAQLQAAPQSIQTGRPVVTVNAGPKGSGKPDRSWLMAPVVGAYKLGGVDGVGGVAAPGITYTTLPGGTVIAPADGQIIFAGQFPKVGRVLILEIGAGYDVILAGLDRLDVRTNDAVLAGEPVGAMPKFDHEPRLYFELRQKNGRGMSPAPYIAVVLRKAK